jgi:hypothetical protein
MRSRWLLMAVLAFALTDHASARADDPPVNEAQARAHFQHGEKLTRAGNHAEAFKQFELGYQLSRRPLFLFNMAECARLAGDPARARGLYQRYLEAEPQGKLAPTARERLAALPAPSAPLRPPAPPTAPPASTRVPAVILTPPAVPPPEAGTVAVTPTAPEPSPTEPRRPLYRRWPFWAGVGAVVVASTVTAIALTRGGGGTCPDCTVLDFRR